MWVAFVSIVLALSGVEAIANLTGCHAQARRPHRPQGDLGGRDRSRGLQHHPRAVHAGDLSARSTGARQRYACVPDSLLRRPVGRVAGANRRWIALLSAGNTAITDMISVQYLMARDG